MVGSTAVPSPMPSTVDAEPFKAAFRHHAAGVAVVTADADGTPVALTASSVTSVSADPAVLLFSVSSRTITGRALASVDSAVVHLLGAEDLALAMRCADPSVDRFADPDEWERLATGEPAFLAPRILLRGEVCERLAFGEATVLALAITDIVDRGTGDGAGRSGPLAYHDRRWHVLGEHSRID
jgi:flavin reductase (DIM6/NTAB) family NADH-FMN oxidoreductase RutF